MHRRGRAAGAMNQTSRRCAGVMPVPARSWASDTHRVVPGRPRPARRCQRGRGGTGPLGRLNAVSCMVGAAPLARRPRCAGRVQQAGADIGLHLDLTEAPLRLSRQALPVLILRSHAHVLAPGALATRSRRSWMPSRPCWGGRPTMSTASTMCTNCPRCAMPWSRCCSGATAATVPGCAARATRRTWCRRPGSRLAAALKPRSSRRWVRPGSGWRRARSSTERPPAGRVRLQRSPGRLSSLVASLAPCCTRR